jgi:phosphodiesterase/alkaline phosphatase D-like protein
MEPALAGERASITHGPILGRIGSHHVGVWARTSRHGAFQVRFGLKPDKLDQLSGPAVTRLERDNTGWVLIEGLKANTRYYYQVVVPSDEGERPGPTGTFRTMPDPDACRDPKVNPHGLFNFRFEFACGNHQRRFRSGKCVQPVFDTMLAKIRGEIDFAILNGDWLYEAQRGYSPEQWLKQVRRPREATPSVVRIAPCIVGVWQNYKLYLERGKALATWHRHVPSFFVFDDHEILDDARGAGSVGLRDHRAVFRDIGVQAWYDYLGWSNPVEFTQGIVFGRARLRNGSDVLADPTADFTRLKLNQASNLHVHWGGPTAWRHEKRFDGVGGDPNAGVYEIVEVLGKDRLRIRPAARKDGDASYSIGRLSYYRMRVANCEFFVLDTRSHRQMPIQAQPDQPGQSLLGARQKSWLKRAMRESDADFSFVVSSVNLVIPHILDVGERGPDAWSGQHDSWTGFPKERKEMIEFWDSLGKPVFVLTGDLHNSFAVRITDRLWEFGAGPHSSSNAGMASEGKRPPNGAFEYRGRKCEIRWSTYRRRDSRGYRQPVYCVVQVNNVFNNPTRRGKDRWVAFPRPQVVFQYYDGLTGRLLYAESILAGQ